MKKANPNEIKRGQALSFRIPSDTPDHILRQLQKLKETERRNFSSKIADYVLQGVGNSYSRERESITIPLPRNLSKSQRDWIKHEHSEALLGNIVYHLLTDPIRATALLASLNSKSTEIDEALYLQEEEMDLPSATVDSPVIEETASTAENDPMDDDLDSFVWESIKQTETSEKESEEKEEDLDDLLGDFLAKMNK
jgi:ribosomal protein L12E/L44/L45/RPP1/RPP2